MPRKNRNARRIVYRKRLNIKFPYVRLCKLDDDGIRPGVLVAAAEYVVPVYRRHKEMKV